MMIGPLMLDLRGMNLDAEEREKLRHPLVGGVILFTRNYRDPEQIADLICEVRALKTPPLLVAVDHEGAPIQRFRDGFVELPGCVEVGNLWRKDEMRARQMAFDLGWVMAGELRAVGVDFSFAPVLDLRTGVSRVVDQRALHPDPVVVAELAIAYIGGMRRGGMAAVAKHFPGHGSVAPDSHHELPFDERDFDTIANSDLVPFERVIDAGLDALMPAHVVYTRIDALPAGFSPIWLQQVLRQRLNFQGAVFSDDISMAGAAVAGGYAMRLERALEAGCDMVLVCNNPAAATEMLEQGRACASPVSTSRLRRMRGKPTPGWKALHADENWWSAVRRLASCPR